MLYAGLFCCNLLGVALGRRGHGPCCAPNDGISRAAAAQVGSIDKLLGAGTMSSHDPRPSVDGARQDAKPSAPATRGRIESTAKKEASAAVPGVQINRL